MRIHLEHTEYIHAQPNQAGDVEIQGSAKGGMSRDLGVGFGFYIPLDQAENLANEILELVAMLKKFRNSEDKRGAQ